MADIASFPTIRNVLVSGDNIQPFTAGAAITAGQIVSFHGTGVSKTVHPCVTGTTTQIVGVALYSVGSGAEVAVACRGCVAYIANGESDAGLDAGDPVGGYGTTTAGTGKTQSLTGGVAPAYIVGFALDDIGNSGTGQVDIAPGLITPAV